MASYLRALITVALGLASVACGKTESPAKSAASTLSEPFEKLAPPEVISFANDWPLPNFDYDNTRNSRTRIDSSNVQSLRESWRFELPKAGGTFFGYIVSNPLILGGVLYFQDIQSNIYAVDRATGKEVWSRRYDELSSGPNGLAIGWGKIFFQVGVAGIVRAIGLENGKDEWMTPLDLMDSEGVDIQPTVFDNQVLLSTVPLNRESGVYAPGSRGVLYSLNATSGSEHWSFNTVKQEPYVAPDSNGGGGAWYPPLIDTKRNLTYWGTGNPAPFPDDGSRPGPNLYTSSVLAVTLREGRLAWYYQDVAHDIFDWDFQSTPVYARGGGPKGRDVVIGSGKTGAAAALDPETGERLWRTKVGKHQNEELNGEGKKALAALVEVLPGAFGGVLSAPAYADGVLYVPSSDISQLFDGTSTVPNFIGGTGTVTAIETKSGNVLWTASTQGACYGAATIANDLVLTVDENGRVYAFERQTGHEVWHYDVKGRVNAPLVVAGDEVFVGDGQNGVVVALTIGDTAGESSSADAGVRSDRAADSGDSTFSAIYRDIIQGEGCTSGPVCHGTPAGGLKMSSKSDAYEALVNVKAMGIGDNTTGCGSTGFTRVVPGDPDASLLVRKVEAAKPDCGARMPPGGMVSSEHIARIRKWIQDGARDN